MPFVFAYPKQLVIVEDGWQLVLNDEIRVTAVSIPGHTPGWITWMTDEHLYTGDAYIPGIKVVTKSPYGDRRIASRSVALIRSLASNRAICPHSIDYSHDITLI